MAKTGEHDAGKPIALEVIDEINKKLDTFTPRQRALAEYILQNPESPAFLSITDLAKEAAVSEATIVRFSHTLGYDGYASLAREAQQAIQVELGTEGRFRLVHRLQREPKKAEPKTAFERVINSEIDNLMSLSKAVKKDDFYRCVDWMGEADRICVIGCMSSKTLAIHFGNMLAKLVGHLDVVYENSSATSAAVHHLSTRSLVFLIAFPRYPKLTVALGRMAAERGARVVAITNSHISPVVPLANLSFALPMGIPSFVDAYAGPLTFINALITELSEQNPEISREALSQYDKYASRMEIFEVMRAPRKGSEHITGGPGSLPPNTDD